MAQIPAPEENPGDHVDNLTNASQPTPAATSWLKPMWPIAIIALCAEMGTSVLNNSTLPVFYQKGLGIGTDIMALIMIPFFIGEVLFKSPLGILADRFGRRPLVLLGCCVTIFTPLLVKSIHYSAGSSDALACLFAFGFLRLLDGFGGAAIWPPLYAYVGDEIPEEKRGAAMGLMNVMYMLGLAFSFYVGGKLDDDFDPILTGQTSLRGQMHLLGNRMHAMVRNLSQRIAHHGLHGPLTAGAGPQPDALTLAMSQPRHYYPSFILVTILFSLAAILTIVCMRRGKPKSATGGADGPAITWDSFKNAMGRIPEFFLLAFITFFGIGNIANLVKIFAVDEFHLTEQRIGVLMLITALIISATAYPLGHLADAWGKSRSVRLGFVLCAAGLWGIPLLHGFHVVHETAFVGSAAVMGIGFVIAFPAWNALLTSLSDESHRATVFSTVSTAQGVGLLVGLLTGDILYKHVSHIAPFTTSAAFVTVSALLSFVFVRESRLRSRI